MRRRVVVTGLGAVTPVGIGVKDFFASLRAGTPGIDTITRFDASAYPCRVAAEVRGFDARDFMIAKRAAVTTRFVQLGVAAARMAYEDAGLPPDGVAAVRYPVCFASSANAVPEFQQSVQEFTRSPSARISPSVLLESIGHAATNHVAVELGLRGPVMTLASGCASALDGMHWAADQIRSGRTPAVLVGATDAPLSTAVLAAWSAMRLLSTWAGPPAQALRPFDALMDGLVLGEGAGAYLIEELEHARSRGVKIYGELLGYGMGTEGLHVGSDPRGASIQTAVRAALRTAGLGPLDIDYINTHGTGSPEHDRAETAAYREVLGRQAYAIPVSSIKPMIGQSFAAAGALQVIAACFALEEQFVPPTLNHDIPDAACDLDYVPWRGRAARVRQVLVTTRTLGPTYSAVVLGRVDR